MSKIFFYHGDNKDLIKAVKVANEIFPIVIKDLQRLNKKIMTGKKDVWHKDFTTRNLANGLNSYSPLIKMEVKEYEYRNGNVMGYFTASRPNDINLNTKSFPRKIWSIVATLYHELIHNYDLYSSYDLSHGHGWFRNKYKKWKEDCAPYLVDEVVESLAAFYLGIDIPDLIEMGRTNNSNYKSIPWWKRKLFFWRY